jgi:hypothetical protein
MASGAILPNSGLQKLVAGDTLNETDINQVMEAVETNTTNSSLLKKTVTFSSGYATISAADLGVTNVAAHKWIAQATMNSSVPVCVYIRLYIGGMALYLYTHTGSPAPDGDYDIFIRKD